VPTRPEPPRDERVDRTERVSVGAGDRPEAAAGGALSLATQPTLPNPAPYVARTRKWALVFVVVASFALVAWVASPLWVPLLIGVVMAVSAQRPFALLVRRLGERRSRLAAAVVTLASGVVVAVVGALVLMTLTNELLKLVTHLRGHASTGSLAGIIGERGARTIANMGIDTARAYGWLFEKLQDASSYAATLAAMIVRTASYGVLGLVVALLTMYYVLIAGPSLARRIERVAPLELRHTRALLVEAREVGRTAFLGTLATAAIQGVIAGVGYALFGVPEPVTWGVVTALASFLPVIGTGLVWGSISAWLLVEGHPVLAVLLAAWGFVVVTSLVDYVIRPRIVGSYGHGHPLLTLIALLGGIEVFGLVGLVIAPILMSVFVAAFRIYEREVRAGAVPGADPAADTSASSGASASSASGTSPGVS
jgi:predicted PurR-regulated permease PerM